MTDGVAGNKPVVALESTIYTHGALGNDLAKEHVDLVRQHGGIPAIIALVDGVPTRHGQGFKAGYRLAGIRVFGTGGLGGVHRGGENSTDVSADLTELGRTRVAVISSGCKGFLDIPRTLEFLETQGNLVATFADGRSGSVDFPAFWARDSGTKSPAVVQDEKEAAAIIYSQEVLGIESGLLFANPVSEEHGIPAPEMASAIETAISEANEEGFSGSSNTPYVLNRLKEIMGPNAVASNRQSSREQRGRRRFSKRS